MILLDDYPSVVYLAPQKLRGVSHLGDCFLLKFLHEEVSENGRKGGLHDHAIDLLIDSTIKPEVQCLLVPTYSSVTNFLI